MIRSCCAEGFGTLILVMTVVGSGIMADSLSNNISAITLIGNTLATGCILFVLITILTPISGAHLNPAVTLAFFCAEEVPIKKASFYIISQIFGGLAGVALAHIMFDLPIFQISEIDRTSLPLYFSEIIATFGLIFVIFTGRRFRPTAIPLLVGLYISAGYWFSSSTSFANPAVTIARTFTDTFTGISPSAIGFFIVAQLLAAWPAMKFASWLMQNK
jgi:glycerol uptake facilitator-like aquaporin